MTTEYCTYIEHNLSGKILFQNVRSLRANFNKVKDITLNNKYAPDIIAMQEIWAPHPWQHNLDKYHPLEGIEREGSIMNKGGGVGLFIKKSIPYTLLEKVITKNLEYIIIKTPHNIVGNIYRPPKGNLSEYIKLLKSLLLKYFINDKKHQSIFGGDFNLNFLDTKHNFVQETCTLMHEIGFGNIIHSPTRITEKSQTLIDAIFCNNSTKKGEIIISDISDHLGITTMLNGTKQTLKEQYIWTNDIRKANLDLFKEQLKNQSWTSVLHSNNPCDTFHEILDTLFNLTCPKIKRKVNKNKHPHTPWMTKGIMISRHTKVNLHKLAIKTKNFSNFKKYRNIYNRVIKAAKMKLLQTNLNENSGNCKKIWQITNDYINKTRNNKEAIEKVSHQGKIITEKGYICNTFNNFFSSIGEKLANELSTKRVNKTPTNVLSTKKVKMTSTTEKVSDHHEHKFNFQKTNEEEILKIITAMKPKISTGHDNMSNYILKIIKYEICKPITHIINHAIQNDSFPQKWKIAKVIPLYKGKGSKEDLSNYRPISLLPTFSKIIEKILDKQLREFLEGNNILYSNQFGFRKGHQTTHIIMAAQDFIIEAGKNNEKIIGIFMDLKKAFDSVDHNILLNKLAKYGIHTKLLKSYLTNRMQYTVIDNYKSKKHTIKFGVPQGSILGPLLFTIFINDLHEATAEKILLFADDSSIFIKEKTTEGLIEKTNKALLDTYDWFSKHNLTVHIGKTNFIVFNDNNRENYNGKIILNNDKLERIGEKEKMKSTKFIGVHIDEDLSWKRHIDYVTKKINCNLHVITANKKIFPLQIRKTLYNAFLRPYLEYGVEAWGGKALNKLTKLQKKCIRHVAGTKNYIAHSTPILFMLNTVSFEDLYKNKLKLLIYKRKQNTLPKGLNNLFKVNPNFGERTLRKHREFEEPSIRNIKYKYCPRYIAPKIWNKLDTSTKNIQTERSFKINIKKKTIQEYEEFKCLTPHCASCSVARPLWN